MKVARPIALLALVSCDRASAPAVATTPGAAARSTSSVVAVGRSVTDAFVRRRPAWYERRGVDHCAYVDDRGRSSACIDAIGIETDPVRARYMRRLQEAWVGTEPRMASAEVAECCNASGPCGAPKRTGHADCPKMDDGHACLVAAELLASAGRDPRRLHRRACACDPDRASVPIVGGTLACEGPLEVERRPMAADEARDVKACATCDPAEGATACIAEMRRLAGRDPEVAAYIERVHVTRCQLP